MTRGLGTLVEDIITHAAELVLAKPRFAGRSIPPAAFAASNRSTLLRDVVARQPGVRTSLAARYTDDLIRQPEELRALLGDGAAWSGEPRTRRPRLRVGLP